MAMPITFQTSNLDVLFTAKDAGSRVRFASVQSNYTHLVPKFYIWFKISVIKCFTLMISISAVFLKCRPIINSQLTGVPAMTQT